MIDEADRLLAQSFQDWLAQVLAATRAPMDDRSKAILSPPGVPEESERMRQSNSSALVPDGLSPTLLYGLNQLTVTPSFFLEQRESSCQKLLFSATLTRDPGKITALNLRKPKYFVVQGSEKESPASGVLDVVMEKFSMPSTLSVSSQDELHCRVSVLISGQEHMVVTDSSQKPLVFFHLTHAQKMTNALVFTKSAESTARLVHLFEFFEAARAENLATSPLVVRAYSSDRPANERKTILEQFKNQNINM